MPGSIEAAAKAAGARLIAGGAVTRAHRLARACARSTCRTAAGETERIDCDLVCVSGGWSPTVHLTSHLGAPAGLERARSPPSCPARCRRAWPSPAPPTASSALADALAAGARAGLQAAADCGFSGQPVDVPEVDPESTAVTPLWRVRGTRGKAFVDFQNDVTDDDVALAEREGFRSVEHLKRYTTLGMATDQGKTSNVNGLALMAELTAKTIPQTGTTTFRPPYAPVAIGALAGHASRQGLPADAAAAVAPAGRRSRAPCSSRPATGCARNGIRGPARPTGSRASTARCARCARASACATSPRSARSTCRAPDAAEFLDRVYTNTLSTLPSAGRATA